MTIEPAATPFPLPETLTRFFRRNPRSRVPVAEAAALAGMSEKTFRTLLRAEGGHGSGSTLSWSEAAAYLFDAWPRARVLDALGPAASETIPPEFHLTRVDWSLPVFLVRALEHQAARDRQHDPRLGRAVPVNPAHGRWIDDYVADVLYADVREETLTAFRNDREFLRAFHFPMIE